MTRTFPCVDACCLGKETPTDNPSYHASFNSIHGCWQKYFKLLFWSIENTVWTVCNSVGVQILLNYFLIFHFQVVSYLFLSNILRFLSARPSVMVNRNNFLQLCTVKLWTKSNTKHKTSKCIVYNHCHDAIRLGANTKFKPWPIKEITFVDIVSFGLNKDKVVWTFLVNEPI